MTTATTRLTDHDRRIIAEARKLAGRRPGQALKPDDLRAHLTDAGIIKDGDIGDLLYPIAYGNAIGLMRSLADLAERLGGDDNPGGGPLCPEGCGCRLGTDDADRFECGCDGGCCGADA